VDRTWTTSHLAALTAAADPLPFMPQAPALAGRTVRQWVRLRRGGTALRIELSNEFGHDPLVLAGVHLGDDRPALLEGRERWVVAPGETRRSGPVDLRTAGGDELTVTVAVTMAGPPTFLHSAQRTALLAAGDQRGRAMPDGAETSPSAFWLTRVLTDASAAGPVVVTLGDSITRGDATTPDADRRYPDRLQELLGSDAAVLNAGIGGNRLLSARVGPAMLERFDRDVSSVAEATHVVVLGGLNDLAIPGILGGTPPGADVLVAGLEALVRRARACGITPLLATIPPAGASTIPAFATSGVEVTRREVNRLLLARDEVAVVDVASVLADPRDPSRLAPAFAARDGVHLSDAGAVALADEVASGLAHGREAGPARQR
jgi:lysophospholipase L1-like esterase